MPDVDRVTTLEIRDPVPLLVDVKPDDPSRHAAGRLHDSGAT